MTTEKGFKGEMRKYFGYTQEELYTPQERDYLGDAQETRKKKQEEEDEEA